MNSRLFRRICSNAYTFLDIHYKGFCPSTLLLKHTSGERILQFSSLCKDELPITAKFISLMFYFNRIFNLHFSYKGLLGPVHLAPSLYKNGEKNLRFCENVYTEMPQKCHKDGGFQKRYQKWIPTKREVFENACERTQTEVSRNTPISNKERLQTYERATEIDRLQQ